MTERLRQRWPGAGAARLDNAYLLLTITMACWASNMVVARAGVGHIPPVALAQLRWSVALLILLPFTAHLVRRDWKTVRAGWKPMALLGFVGISTYNTLVYVGLGSTTAVNAVLLASIFPVVVAAIGFVLYRDRLTAAQLGGIAITCVGAAIILSRGELSVLTEFRLNAGDLWVLTAHLTYALYTVMLRERPSVHPLTFLTVTIAIGQALLLPFTLAEAAFTDARLHADLFTAATVFYVALVPAILAYICFNKAVAIVGSNRAAPFFHLVPVFGSLGAVAFLGESIGLHHVAGWGMILAGIVATQVGRARG